MAPGWRFTADIWCERFGSSDPDYKSRVGLGTVGFDAGSDATVEFRLFCDDVDHWFSGVASDADWVFEALGWAMADFGCTAAKVRPLGSHRLFAWL